MQFFAAIVAALKAIPALAGLVDKFLSEWQAYEVRKREADAAARKTGKDAAVDAAIDGVPGATGGAGQLPKVDGTT